MDLFKDFDSKFKSGLCKTIISNQVDRSFCDSKGKDVSLDGSWRNETCMKYVLETYTNCPTQERADFFNCDKKEYFCESDLKDVIDG